MKNQTRTQGFTLIELLIVIAIIGILAAVLIPNLLGARNRSNDSATQSYVRNCITAVETARDSVSQKLPLAANVANCESTGLGDAKLTKPSTVTSSTVTIDNAKDTYKIEAESVTGKKFQYNGTEVVALP